MPAAMSELGEPGNLNSFDYSYVPHTARVAVYDDLKMPPHIIEIEPAATPDFIEHLASCINDEKTKQGGKIPYGAIREVTEECNIHGHIIKGTLPPSYHTYLFDNKPYMKKTSWFRMSYSGEMITDPQASEGITHAQWLVPNEIARIKSNTFQSLLDLLNFTLRV